MTKKKDPEDLLKVGRKRTVSLPEDDMIELGKEMIAWVKKHNPMHITQWYSLEKHITFKQWETFKERPEFVPYYEEAINLIAINYIDGTINNSIAQRFLRLYFKDLRKEEDENARYLASLKKEEVEDTTPEQKRLIKQLCDELNNYRKNN